MKRKAPEGDGKIPVPLPDEALPEIDAIRAILAEEQSLEQIVMQAIQDDIKRLREHPAFKEA